MIVRVQSLYIVIKLRNKKEVFCESGIHLRTSQKPYYLIYTLFFSVQKTIFLVRKQISKNVMVCISKSKKSGRQQHSKNAVINLKLVLNPVYRYTSTT